MAWLVPYSNLTEEQIRAVEAPTSSPRFIIGAPGSGKSLILVHRAARLRVRQNANSSRYRILVFTKVLKDYIRSACLQLGLEDECVSTFDGWCADYHKKHIGKQPWNARTKQPDFSATRNAVLAHARATKNKSLDFVLIDEGQDLDELAFEILNTVASHVTVCADYKQRIYDTGTTEEGIAKHIGLRGANVNLLSAFRCSPDLVPLAALFVDDPDERHIFIEQTRTWSDATEVPLLYLASNFSSERERLAEVIRERLYANERVAVLLPQARQVAGFAAGLAELGITVESQTASSRNSFLKLDFDSPNPKVMTYHSAKGLTFDSVLMPRLVEGSFSRVAPATRKRLLFVGITRAVKWVYLSAVESDRLTIMADIVKNGNDNIIEIQRTLTARGSGAPTDVESSDSEPSLDDLF